MKLTDFVKSTTTARMELAVGDETAWLDIRSTNSDEFAAAKGQFEQAFSSLLLAGKTLITKKVILGQEISERSDDYEKLLSIMLASLISEWSFEDELNAESAAQFLYNNRSVRTKVDEAATKLSAGEEAKKKPL
jgi:hypothetical protein